MKIEKILVTGSSGFIGKKILQHLSKKKLKVYCPARKNKKNYKNIFFFKKNLQSKVIFNKYCDIIIHGAAKSPYNNKFNSKDYKANILMTESVIKYSKKFRPKKIIFLSSLSVHGTILSKEVNEKTKINKPDLYGRSKLICEKKLLSISKEIPVVSIRLPGVIGKNSVRNWLTTTLDQIKKNKVISVYNLNQKFNNLIHVDDLVLFIISLIKFKFKGFHNIYLGTKKPIKIRSIIDLFIKYINKKVEFKKLRINKKNFLIDYTYARNYFKYKPAFTKTRIVKFINENK